MSSSLSRSSPSLCSDLCVLVTIPPFSLHLHTASSCSVVLILLLHGKLCPPRGVSTSLLFFPVTRFISFNCPLPSLTSVTSHFPSAQQVSELQAATKGSGDSCCCRSRVRVRTRLHLKSLWCRIWRYFLHRRFVQGYQRWNQGC